MNDRDLEQAAEILGAMKDLFKEFENRLGEVVSTQRIASSEARAEGAKVSKDLHELALSARILVNEQRDLHFGCHCSRERVAAVLRNLGRDESEAALQSDGRIEVTCEFCNAHYHFDRIDLEQVFSEQPEPPGSDSTH